MDEGLPELQALDPEAVIVVRFILLDVVPGLQSRQDAENVVFVQLQFFAEFRDSQFVQVSAEFLEDVEGMCDRLNDVIRFVAPDHLPPSAPSV
jgi:hypothetical protein